MLRQPVYYKGLEFVICLQWVCSLSYGWWPHIKVQLWLRRKDGTYFISNVYKLPEHSAYFSIEQLDTAAAQHFTSTEAELINTLNAQEPWLLLKIKDRLNYYYQRL